MSKAISLSLKEETLGLEANKHYKTKPWWFLMFFAKESLEAVNYKSLFCFQFIFISNDLEIELPLGFGYKTQSAMHCLCWQRGKWYLALRLWEVKPHNSNIFISGKLFDFGKSELFGVVGSNKRAILSVFQVKVNKVLSVLYSHVYCLYFW